MVGACYEGSGIKLSDTLDNPNFKPHPATESVLDWLTRHGLRWHPQSPYAGALASAWSW